MAWYYLGPKIYHGQKALEIVFELVSADDRVSIVVDPQVKRSEFFSLFLQRLNRTARSVEVFDNINSTPDLSTIMECAAFLSKTTPDWIIGVGGGSTLDTAKAARLLYEDPRLRLDLKDGILLDRSSPRENGRCMLVAIPTTTGTGSEATYGMVVKDQPNLFLLASHRALPNYAILDPIATSSLPRETLAATAMDALGQSIEAYTSNLKNDFSDGHALVSIKLVFEWLRSAYQNPANAEARLKLQNAACLSGLAFGNAPGGLAHAIADGLTPHFNFHHGRAVGVVLPYVMEFNSADSQCRSLYAEIAHNLGFSGDDSRKAKILISKVRALKKAVGIPASMRRAGISKAEWESAMQNMVHRTLEDGIMKNRRPFDGEDAARILRCIWNGRQVYF
jgi:alcohol dehydrogenase class IV